MHPDDDMNGLFSVLRRSGYRITQARRAVIESMADEAGHLTAPDVVQIVQKRSPGVGRASVYRTLDLLTQLGMVRSSTLGGATATYVLAPDRRHHHIVCVECQRTVEFDDCGMEEVQRRLGERLGFELEGHLVEIYGRCPDCQQ